MAAENLFADKKVDKDEINLLKALKKEAKKNQQPSRPGSNPLETELPLCG